jgi:hypothetical protein
MEEQNVIQHFTSLLGQIKLFHWATMSYAKHKALDELHDVLSDKVDLLIEAYIGRMKLQPLKAFLVETKSTTDTSKLEKYLETERDKITALSKKWTKYSDLQNILDEMVAEINKTLYLSRLGL